MKGESDRQIAKSVGSDDKNYNNANVYWVKLIIVQLPKFSMSVLSVLKKKYWYWRCIYRKGNVQNINSNQNSPFGFQYTYSIKFSMRHSLFKHLWVGLLIVN